MDFDEDLHLTDFVNAHQEGYDSVELLKRYSTVGMGPSQGKLSNMNAMRILAKLNGDTIGRDRLDDRPSLLPARAARALGRSALPPDAPDADPRLALRAQRGLCPRWRLVSARILCPRRCQPR